MVVTRMAERLLEPRPSLSEIDFPRDAGANHPLQRPIDGRAADPRIFFANEIAQVIRAQMPFLAQEDTQDAVAFARTLAAGRAQAGEIQDGVIRR